jgi:DNA-directed RNA polymerase subunit RPC12/RpoP
VAIAERLFDADLIEEHEPATLDGVIAAAWQTLTVHRVAQCPFCGERMVPAYGVHALPIGGRCTDCGTELR